MTHIMSIVRARRMLELAHETAGHPWNYTEESARGYIVRNHILNPQLHKWDHKIDEDCSSGVTGLAFAAGLPDPCGFDYKEVGNTGSLMAHLPHINTNDVRPGDFILWSDPEHVALVLSGRGHNAVIWTFGGPPSPHITNATYRSDYLTGLVYTSRVLGYRQ